jgi:hypothetical protein
VKDNVNRLLKSLDTLIQEIRRGDALSTTAGVEKRAESRAETEDVILTLTSGMSETVQVLYNVRHSLTTAATENINKQIALHLMAVELIKVYLER